MTEHKGEGTTMRPVACHVRTDDPQIKPDFVTQVSATVHHWESGDIDGGGYSLMIQLGNDRAITLTVTERSPPTVCVWTGTECHSFLDLRPRSLFGEPGETLESFREFVAAAFEPAAPDVM